MPKYTAKTADKYELYQESVQSPQSEVDFIDRLFKKKNGRTATIFREDFCGTFLISCHWVKKRPENHAYGVDLDTVPLDWGVNHNLSSLKPDAVSRVHLLHQNVFHVTQPKIEIVGAFNFSYFIFKDRRTLVTYFKAVRKSLVPGGLFVLDAYGGWEAQQVVKEKTKQDGFTYVWDQAKYDPITDETLCHIHFKFPDGTMMRNAFSYDWRLWTLGGIRDCLHDAGFSASEVHWEGTTKKGKGNDVFKPAKSATNDPGWVAYIVAMR